MGSIERHASSCVLLVNHITVTRLVVLRRVVDSMIVFDDASMINRGCLFVPPAVSQQ